MAAAEFAARVLNAVAAGQESGLFTTAPALSPPSAPVARVNLQHAADVLDRSITDLKIQIENYISADFDGFRKHLENALTIQAETRALVSELTAVAVKVEDEETGLQARLERIMREQEEAKHELDTTELLISSLQTVSRCMETSAEYDAAIKEVDYYEAVHAVAQMAEQLEQLPHVSNVTLFEELKKRHEDMALGVRDRLEYVLSQGFQVEANSQTVTITITEEVSAPGLGDIPNALPWKDLGPGAIFEKLGLVVRFLVTTIFGPATTQDDDFVDVKLSFFRVIGSIWEDLSKTIIAEYLGTIIPDEPSQFGAFEGIADRCRKFEDWLVDIGMIVEDQRYLSDYCGQMDVHFAQRKHTKLLRVARDILLSDDHETVVVDEKEPEASFNDLFKSIDGVSDIISTAKPTSRRKSSSNALLRFPKCAISRQTQKLMALIDSILQEAETFNSYCAGRLCATTRDILDLYRAVMPVHNTQKFDLIPHMAIIFHNDCMYIAHRLMTLRMEQPDKLVKALAPESKLVFADLVTPYRVMGERVFNAQLKKQIRNLRECVDNADGFDMLESKRCEIVERAVKQIMHQLNLLAKLWKPILPQHLHFRAIGVLIDEVLVSIIKEVERLVDIAADESQRLNELLTRLQACRDFFVSESTSSTMKADKEKLIRLYVPHYNKFVELTELLDLGFAVIMERFRSGRLREFESEELQRLVRALFADTPLRVKNLEEIGRGGQGSR
ncbi:Centromere/kinetochore protein zw10 [Rhizophlyctis rosea]|uniref:Centromere/kinetochore protein zw10 n=1 Tax=Rhizophlyctis rosea TaxID=64517 RepID=A0AAD5SKX0_9FUNG|nr:Centromere/kinetochore protein zw10 [Rhizophlyctis rosea]